MCHIRGAQQSEPKNAKIYGFFSLQIRLFVFRAICGIVGLALFVGTFYDAVRRYKRNKPESEEATTLRDTSIELKSYKPKNDPVYTTSNTALNGHDVGNVHVSTDIENSKTSLEPSTVNLQASTGTSMFRSFHLNII